MNKMLRPRLAGTLALVLVFALAPTAFAADGEIGNMGDQNSVGNIFVNAQGRAAVNIEYPHDCPPQLGCSIDVMFEHKCPEIWCLGYGNQGWRPIPLPNAQGISKVVADCMPDGDEDNYWQIQYRVRWWASQVKTVELWGEYESGLNFNGSIGYKLIAEAGFNVTNGGGFRGGFKIQTNTAIQEDSDPVLVTTSGGVVLHTC